MVATGVVVIGGYINGLGLVRSLAARGVPVAVINTQVYDIAHRSKWVRGFENVCRTDDDPDALAEVLLRRSGEWNGWALLPSTDGALAAINRHRERLVSHYRIIAPSAEAARILLDKSLMRQHAESVRIAVPRCYGMADRSLATEGMAFPVVVKPVVGYRFAHEFECKLFMAENRTRLDRVIDRIERAGVECQVFDCVPGADDRIYAHCEYIDQRGQSRGGLTIHKLRQSPPFFGVARVAEVVPTIPELREATIELARRIGLRGVAVAEFKLDERDHSWRFMEINGRSVIYNALLRQAGLDLAGLAYSEHVQNEREIACPNGWSGVWVNLHADVLYSLFGRRKQHVRWGDFIAPYTRPVIEAAWSITDPRPFLLQWSRTLRRAARSDGSTP